MAPARPVMAAVMGPTASGKSALAEALAEELDAQLLNADAFQVYRGLDIGTAKPANRDRYRLLDLVDPDESFGLGAWIGLAQLELDRLWLEQRNVVVVGGTGLYIRALFEEYTGMTASPDPEVRADLVERERSEGIASLRAELERLNPEAFARIDASNPLRVRRALEVHHSKSPHVVVTLPPYAKVKVAIDADRAILGDLISSRARAMLDAGWAQEVKDLRTSGYADSDPGMRAIGYREVGRMVDGELTREEAVAVIVTGTRRYAKRQQTWLRSEPNLNRCQFELPNARLASALDWIGEAARS